MKFSLNLLKLCSMCFCDNFLSLNKFWLKTLKLHFWGPIQVASNNLSKIYCLQRMKHLFQIIDAQAWRERLTELFCLVFIFNDQCIKIFAALYLELGVRLVFLDLDRFGICAVSRQDELFDFTDKFGHL